MSAVAAFENDRRRERQLEGIAAAKIAGRYKGRKTVITPTLVSEVRTLKQVKMLSVSQIVKITGKSRNTIYKILKQHLGYKTNRLVQTHENKEKRKKI